MVIPSINRASELFTGYLGTIGSDHAYVHKGLAFTSIITTPSISAAYVIGFTTPTVASGKYIHWRPIGISSSADHVSFQLTEDESFTSGTAVTPINRNRNSSAATNMQTFAYGVTATPAGDVIQAGAIGTSGNPAARSGGDSAADQELVLIPNTSYLLTLTPAGATVCVVELFWYEEGRGT